MLFNIFIRNKLRILKPIINCVSNIHLFVILVNNRDDLKSYLENNNISCAIHYPNPFYDSIAYKHVIVNNDDKMQEYTNKLLSLPMYPELLEEQVMYICNLINDFYT